MPRFGFSARPGVVVRTGLFVAGDVLLWLGSWYVASLLRFDGAIPARFASGMVLAVAVLVPVKLAWHAAYRLYHLTWRTVGLSDLVNILKANTLALATVAAAAFLLRRPGIRMLFPVSILLMDYVLSVCGVAAFRGSPRVWLLQLRVRASRRRRKGIRLLIVGAGETGARIAQALQESSNDRYVPVGFVDDDPDKHGAFVHGLKVFGGTQAIPGLLRDRGIQEVLIALPARHAARVREVMTHVREAGVQHVKVFPDMHEWLAGRAFSRDAREVNPMDLLKRPPVRIQYDALKTYLTGKRVLVTGAAGSIGFELVRQLSNFEVAHITACDINESGLFDLEQELQRDIPGCPLRISLADIRDDRKIDWLVGTARPHIIFHAAGYKHVPLMEREVEEAVKTNIFGTQIVGEAALRHGVESFVFISTDNAVNPTSVLGTSKRVGELVAKALGCRGRTRCLIVRFGNVLGSRGSIMPVFQKQVRRGGPVTVTHPDMARHFMTIPEAALLVLETPLMISGSAFTLDTGEPLRIMELAREFIRRSGMDADVDIPIVFSGIRAGEKIEEDLVTPGERRIRTAFDHVFEVQSSEAVDEAALRLVLRELERLVETFDSEGIRALLQRIAQTPSWTSAAVSPVIR
jgi:FlaA1/EpsC-like NDP-sugar epimerase